MLYLTEMYCIVEDLDLEVINKMKCNFCGECREACKSLEVPNFVRVRHSSDRFYFTVEVSEGCVKLCNVIPFSLRVVCQPSRF